MKKFNLSLVAILATSTFAMAGGDIAPVEPVVEYVEPAAVGGFYIGGAYAWQRLLVEGSAYGLKHIDDNFGGIMIDAGYKFNPYIAIEGRYTFGLSSTNDLGWRTDIRSDITVDTWGIYAKPMYPVSDAFNIYALLGWGAADVTYDVPNGGTLTSSSLDGFSWGLGADYAFNDNWALFVDYTSAINAETTTVDTIPVEVTVRSVNFGVNYTF